MYINYNSKLNCNVINIFVGEYYITDKEEIISTLLGSCIGVCLMDVQNKVYGMNHFLLPGNIIDNVELNESARFGSYSMELLVDSMLKKGAVKTNLQAKIYGGGKMIETVSDIVTVNSDNINFTREYLKLNEIPILAEDVGGTNGRRIYFNTADCSVSVEKVKKIKKSEI